MRMWASELTVENRVLRFVRYIWFERRETRSLGTCSTNEFTDVNGLSSTADHESMSHTLEHTRHTSLHIPFDGPYTVLTQGDQTSQLTTARESLWREAGVTRQVLHNPNRICAEMVERGEHVTTRTMR